MSLNEFLSWVVPVAFFALALFACIDLGRNPDQMRLDLALLFTTLALAIVMLTRQASTLPLWLQLPGDLAIVAQPYLLLRLIPYFRPVPKAVQQAAFLGMVISGILVVFTPLERPAVFTWMIAAYFVLVEGYASWAFIQCAFSSEGANRYRLSFAAIASGMLGLALWIATIGVAINLPQLNSPLQAIGFVLLLGAAIFYYITFNPPYLLRQSWQHAQLLHFLSEAANQPARSRARSTLDLLCTTALQTTGGTAAAVALWSEKLGRLIIMPQDKYPTLVGPLDIYEGVIAEAWGQNEPAIADTPTALGTDAARLADMVDAAVVMAIPISTSNHIYGLLLVFHQRRSLFIHSDISLLSLLTQQTAMSLEYDDVLIEQDALIETLRQTDARNRALDNLSQAVAALSFDTRAILDTVALRTAESIGDGAMINRPSKETGQLEAVAVHYPNVEEMMVSQQISRTAPQRVSEGIIRQVFETGQPVLISETSTDQFSSFMPTDFAAYLNHFGVYGIICVPLKVKGFIIGTLAVWRDSPGRPYTEDERVFLQIVADRTALALDNAELTQELEERVVERTFELETANRDLRAFSHTVAHQVKNPLTQIIGFAQLTMMEQGEVMNEVAQHCLNMIVDGAEKMNNIISSLLLLANVRETNVNLTPLDMNEIVEQALMRIMPQIEETQARITTAEDWPEVKGHNVWIEEVWVNYLTNALKYGGKPPQIEFGWTPENDEMVKFWLKDSGPGIPLKQQHRLFAPFVRLHTGSAEGHGLGLSIVRRIVEKCGGEVGVQSEGEAGKGTKFWFTLRRVPTPHSKEEHEIQGVQSVPSGQRL